MQLTKPMFEIGAAANHEEEEDLEALEGGAEAVEVMTIHPLHTTPTRRHRGRRKPHPRKQRHRGLHRLSKALDSGQEQWEVR